MRLARRIRGLPDSVFAVILMIFLSACGSAARSLPNPTSTGGTDAPIASSASPHWVLTWSDEFNSQASLAKWSFATGGGGWGEHQLQWYEASNAVITTHGYLAITADNRGNGHTCWYGPCRYTSARMDTLTSFSQAYGRFEARIKLPPGQGLWPAFWIEGTNVNQVPWPACGEVDIIEKNGTKPDELEGFAHMASGQYSALSSYPGPLSSAFHVYGIDWTPRGITWTIDGKPYGYMGRFPGWPFDHAFFIILNLAVGGYWPGPPSASTQFPSRMLVDWIRVYQQAATG